MVAKRTYGPITTLPEIEVRASRGIDPFSWAMLAGVGDVANRAVDRMTRWSDVIERVAARRAGLVDSAVQRWAAKLAESGLSTLAEAAKLSGLKQYEIADLAAGRMPARLAETGLTWAQLEKLFAQASQTPAARIAGTAGRALLGPEAAIAAIIGTVIAEVLNRVSQSALDEAGRLATEPTPVQRPDSVPVQVSQPQPMPESAPIPTLAPIDAVSTRPATLADVDRLSRPLSDVSPSVEVPTQPVDFAPVQNIGDLLQPVRDLSQLARPAVAPLTQTGPRPIREPAGPKTETSTKECPVPKRKAGKCRVGLWREYKTGDIKYTTWREWKCP